jgi:hypothetical protein
MSRNRRNFAVFLAFAGAAIFLIGPLRSWWWTTAIANRSFSSPFVWLDYAYCLIWLFEVAWSLVAGAVLALALRPSPPVGWAFALGAVGGLFNFALTRNHIGADAPWSYPIWVYGEYFVPLVGAVAGAVLALLLRRTGAAHAA